jgi:integrase
VALLSLVKHIDYLESKGRLAKATINNYRYAAERLNIDIINTDKLSELWTSLSSQLPEPGSEGTPVKGRRFGYVFHVNGAIGSLLARHNITEKGSGYNSFREKLGKLRHVPQGYTDDQLRLLLKASKRSGYNFGLYRLLVFLIYTGVRISSAANVKFSDFKPVEGLNGVFAVRVVGTGRTYDAIISSNALEHMKSKNPKGSDLMSGYKPGIMKSSFSNYNRSLLARAIISKGISQEVSLNTSIFHSIRKAFAARLLEDGVESDMISLLLGQVPRTQKTSKGSAANRLTRTA